MTVAYWPRTTRLTKWRPRGTEIVRLRPAPGAAILIHAVKRTNRMHDSLVPWGYLGRSEGTTGYCQLLISEKLRPEGFNRHTKGPMMRVFVRLSMWVASQDFGVCRMSDLAPRLFGMTKFSAATSHSRVPSGLCLPHRLHLPTHRNRSQSFDNSAVEIDQFRFRQLLKSIFIDQSCFPSRAELPRALCLVFATWSRPWPIAATDRRAPVS